jgi:integrase/recombinase XerC
MRWFPLDKLTLLEAAISEEIEHGTWTRRRDALAVALGLHGLRVGEVCRTRREDLFVGGGVLAVRSLKRGLPREIPLHASTVTALLDWRVGARHSWLLHTRSGNQVHRSQFERAARRLTRAVLGEPLKFHALRHTFAMRLYDETHDLFLVKQMLGHHSVRSTEVYAASLARVPEACLVRLRPDAPGQPAATQLRLFSPTG